MSEMFGQIREMAHRSILQTLRQLLPLGHRQDEPEVRRRPFLAGHGIARTPAHGTGREMSDDLVAAQVEVDPLLRAASLGTAEQLAVEAPRFGEIVHRKGEMEGGKCRHCERSEAIQ